MQLMPLCFDVRCTCQRSFDQRTRGAFGTCCAQANQRCLIRFRSSTVRRSRLGGCEVNVGMDEVVTGQSNGGERRFVNGHMIVAQNISLEAGLLKTSAQLYLLEQSARLVGASSWQTVVAPTPLLDGQPDRWQSDRLQASLATHDRGRLSLCTGGPILSL